MQDELTLPYAYRFISLELLGESVYQGERFLLRFRFDKNYPMEAPEVHPQRFIYIDFVKADGMAHRSSLLSRTSGRLPNILMSIRELRCTLLARCRMI